VEHHPPAEHQHMYVVDAVDAADVVDVGHVGHVGHVVAVAYVAFAVGAHGVDRRHVVASLRHSPVGC